MERPHVPEGLLARLRADPLHAPETIALAAAEAHAPVAERWVAEQRARYGIERRELALRAKAKHAGLARFGGAATGLGGALTVLPDLLALAWIQSRLVLFVAAAFDFDPRDPARPAELLVLQGLYADVPTARAALDGIGRPLAPALLTRGLSGREDEELVRRLLRVVGRRATRGLAGRLVPGVAVLVNAVGNERDTRALADRAIERYDRP
jgi:hypothetical protein